VLEVDTLVRSEKEIAAARRREASRVKRTKAEAQRRLDKIGVLPRIPSKALPPQLRIPYVLGRAIEKLGVLGARGLVQLDPLGRLEAQEVMDVVNDPSIRLSEQGELFQALDDVGMELSPTYKREAPKVKKVTKLMKQQRKIQSTAFKNEERIVSFWV
jgi:hypothetical protein